MSEAAEKYKERLRGYVAGKDPIAMQREAPRTLASLIENLAKDDLARRPAPGKWSPREIIGHLIISPKMNFQVRGGIAR